MPLLQYFRPLRLAALQLLERGKVWAVGTGVGFLAGLAAVGSEGEARPDFLVSHMGELPI